jgi:hypothetical protein
MKRSVLFFLLVAGCTVDGRQYTGPKLSMVLTSNNFDEVSDTDTAPYFTLDTDTEYSIDIRVDTTDGKETTPKSDTNSVVKSMTVTFSVGGANQPAPKLTSDASPFDPQFTSATPLVIPASSMGSTLKVTATATDGNGLASNAINFSIMLN